MIPYIRGKWFWIVGEEALIFSARVFDYVPEDDQDYQAFLASGASPTRTTENDMLLTQIAILEEDKVTERMRQEAMAGSTKQFPGGHEYAGKTAKQAIAAIVAQKDALRGELS